MTDFDNYKLTNLKGLPKEFFRKNREKFIENFKQKNPNIEKNSLLILEGGKEIPRHDTDTVMYHFIQEPYFYYLTGVTYPDFHCIIDLVSGEFTLFIKMPSMVYKIFMHVLTPEEASTEYGLKCFNDKEILDFIHQRNPNKIFYMTGQNSDSGLFFKEFNFKEAFPEKHFSVENEKSISEEIIQKHKSVVEKIEASNTLLEILADTRVTKTKEEIELLKYVAEKTIEGHIKAMKSTKPDCLERDVENYFYSYMRKNYYAREMPYSFICGCNENSSVLHYTKNDDKVLDGSLCLLDIGCRIGGYCSDITSTIPANGTYSKQQKEIYDIVLAANREVLKNLKPGVLWSEMHLLSERIILEGLQKVGVLKKDTKVEELQEKRIGYYFMPHGLGHLLGIDVHDVGGYLSFTNPRKTEKGLKSLRTNRVILENMVLTVEPGIYFREFLFEMAAQDEEIKGYFNYDLLKEYYNFGGIRIEDMVVVTETGCENMCTSLPRTTEEIEKAMAEGK